MAELFALKKAEKTDVLGRSFRVVVVIVVVVVVVELLVALRFVVVSKSRAERRKLF